MMKLYKISMHNEENLEYKMYYRISGKYTTQLDLTKCFVASISRDGSEIIVSANESPNDIEILETIQNNEDFNTLTQQDFWKQPCSNC